MNNKISTLTRFTIVWCILLINACALQNTDTTTKPSNPESVTVCKEPRSSICTREYNPVCATKDTGVRCVTTPCPSTELKTYATGCTACADEKVISYTAGKCTEEKTN